MDKLIPGTNKTFTGIDAYLEFRKMIEITDGLSLGQVMSITGLEMAVIQNWVKRGYVARPVNKKYYEKHFARILMINSLKDAMKIEDIGELMKLVNGDVEDETDDLMHEGELYNLFTRVIYRIDDMDINKAIDSCMKEMGNSNEKLKTALEIMVNAHIASNYKKMAQQYLSRLEEM